MCETRNLGIKWPHWHTLMFEGDRRNGHDVCLPEGCEEDASAASKDSLLEEVGSKALVRRIERGYLTGAGSGILAQEDAGRLVRKASKHGQKIGIGRSVWV